MHVGKNPQFDGLGAPELAGKLRRFYACARGTDGREYCRSSLTTSGLSSIDS